MSILIKGMEMPKACVYRENGHLITCSLYDIDGYCGALNKEASHEENGRLFDCPLMEQKIGKWLHTPTYWYYCSVCNSFPPNETNVKTPYCPYCGAKMVMKEEEGEDDSN